EPGISSLRLLDSGFATSSRPGMTASLALRRADPIAVKAIRHAMAEMHQRDGTCFDVLRVEHREIAAILLRAPDRREQPAIPLGGVSAALDEHRFGNRVAGG